MNIHGCECMVRLEAFIDAGRPVLKKKNPVLLRVRVR